MNIQELIEKIHKQMDSFDFQAINTLFSQPVSIKEDEEEYLEELEYLVGEIRETLVKDRDFRKLEAFAKTLQLYHPQIMEGVGVYFYNDLISHFCSEGNFEQAENYFEHFITDPLNDIGFYLSAFKRLLFYQRNAILLRAIKQNYQEILASEEYAYEFTDFFEITIYFAEVQAVYESSDKIFDIKRLNEKLELINGAVSEAHADAYNRGFFGEVPPAEELKSTFKGNQLLLFELIRNVFMKRMLGKGWQFTLSGMMFDLTKNYWDNQHSRRKKAKWGSYFTFKYKTFENFLFSLGERDVVGNQLEMNALVWGVAYVYDFLREVEIIDAKQYGAFQPIYKLIVAETIGNNLDSLSDKSFVMQWPKPEFITHKEWEAQQSMFRKSKICEFDSSIDLVPFINKELEVFGEYEATILTAYNITLERRSDLLELMLSFLTAEKDELENEYFTLVKSDSLATDQKEIGNRKNIYSDTPYQAEAKPGRNEPCPCGSGKKYKKCCGKNT